jgi:hypothetical protein
MSRQAKTPQEKKKDSYTKDFKNISEYPQAFQKSWPRKKRIVSRSHRRVVAAKVKQIILDPTQPDIEVRAKPAKKLEKWGVMTLKDWVDGRFEGRAYRVAWNYFKTPYNATEHKEAFTKLLDEIVRTKGTERYGQELAKRFSQMLYTATELKLIGLKSARDETARKWFSEYFRDAPEAEKRLRAWLKRVFLRWPI